MNQKSYITVIGTWKYLQTRALLAQSVGSLFELSLLVLGFAHGFRQGRAASLVLRDQQPALAQRTLVLLDLKIIGRFVKKNVSD